MGHYKLFLKRVALIIILFSILLKLECYSQWYQVPSGTQKWISSIYFTSCDTGFFVTSSGSIHKTVDGGESWIEKYSDSEGYPYTNLMSIQFLSSEIGYTGGSFFDSSKGYMFKLLKTTDFGETWDSISVSNGKLESMFYTSVDTGHFLVEYNYLYYKYIKTSDGGETFSNEFSFQDNTYSIFFPSSKIGYIVGGSEGDLPYIMPHRNIFKTTNAGVEWNMIYQSESAPFISTFFYSDDIGWALDKGNIFLSNYSPVMKTIDGGANWISLENPIPINISSYYNKILFTSSETGWVHKGPDIYFSTDGGNIWELDTTLYGGLKDCFFYSNNLGWIGGNGGVLYKYHKNITATESNEIKIQFDIYPNPIQDYLNINIPDIIGSAQVSIIDMQGNLIYRKILNKSKNKIDMHYLSVGVYIMKLYCEKGLVLKKLIKR